MKSSDCSVYPSGNVSSSGALFERREWLYAFFREHIFRDHTEEIRRALFPVGGPPPGLRVLELGCGPGFYTCRLASLFPQIQTIGIDQSVSLLGWARSRASQAHLDNCTFSEGDACAMHDLREQVDAVVVSRLFLIVRDREAALSEVFRILKPGGRCFVAEPTTPFKTRVPLWIMQFFAALSGESGLGSASASIMSADDFRSLVNSQPWKHVELMQRDGYQYAVCTKLPYTKELA